MNYFSFSDLLSSEKDLHTEREMQTTQKILSESKERKDNLNMMNRLKNPLKT
jgi:hypothetical protein